MNFQRDDQLAIFEQLPIAAYVLQNDGFAAFNQAAVDLLGHPLERLKDANYWDLCSPWIRAEARERGRAWIGGAPMDAHSVCPVVNNRGEQKWIEVFRRRIEFRGSEALLVTALDLTEHRAWIEGSLDAIARHGMSAAVAVPRIESDRGLEANDKRRVAEGEADRRIKALTDRQYQVLELVRLGRSNKQIAHALGITEGTTKLHVYHLMRTFKAPNRTFLALIALKTPR